MATKTLTEPSLLVVDVEEGRDARIDGQDHVALAQTRLGGRTVGDDAGEAEDTLRHQFRMFDQMDAVGDDARDEYFVVRQRHVRLVRHKHL